MERTISSYETQSFILRNTPFQSLELYGQPYLNWGAGRPTLCPKVGCNGRSSMKREMFPARPSNGRSPKTLTMRNRAMVISQRIPPTSRKSSSITPTISAVRLTLLMPRPTSPSSMLTCRMANYS